MMTRVWLALAAAGLAVSAGLSAHAAYRAISAHAGPSAIATEPAARGYEVEDHFPGAALLYAEAQTPVASQAAPTKGVTGTTDLPALPIPAAAANAIVTAETGVVPARPFAFGKAGAMDRGRALQCLTAAVYYEAASEPDAGQRAVAQVVLNRVRHPAFPATVCGVVYQGSERAGCQFSFACDGSMARIPARAAWQRAERNAAMELAGYVYTGVGLATHYHTYAVTPAWNRSLVMTDAVGAHFFHRWKGYWGTAAAFGQPYAGHEPEPGPHMPIAPVAPPAPLIPADTLLAQAAPPPPASPGQTASSGVTVASAPQMAGDSLPPASQILDKWKDSGKPL